MSECACEHVHGCAWTSERDYLCACVSARECEWASECYCVHVCLLVSTRVSVNEQVNVTVCAWLCEPAREYAQVWSYLLNKSTGKCKTITFLSLDWRVWVLPAYLTKKDKRLWPKMATTNKEKQPQAAPKEINQVAPSGGSFNQCLK